MTERNEESKITVVIGLQLVIALLELCIQRYVNMNVSIIIIITLDGWRLS